MRGTVTSGCATSRREPPTARANQLRNYGVGLILGLAAVGYVQAASTLMGPFMVIFFGMGLVTLPEAARVLRRSPRHLPLFCACWSAPGWPCGARLGGRAAGGAAAGTRELVLGPIWRPTYPLVLPTDDLRRGRLHLRGRRPRPARPRGRAAEPAR